MVRGSSEIQAVWWIFLSFFGWSGLFFFLSSLTKVSACCLRLAYGFGLIKIFNKHKLSRNKVEKEATQQMGVTEGLRRVEKRRRAGLLLELRCRNWAAGKGV